MFSCSGVQASVDPVLCGNAMFFFNNSLRTLHLWCERLDAQELNVPACLTLLPGQLQMLKEVVDKERSRRRARTPTRAPPSPLSVPLPAARSLTLMAVAPVKQRSGPAGARAQLPPCYYEGYLEKRGPKEKASRRLWTCLCGNAMFFFNNPKDTHYVERLDLSSFVSLRDDCSRDRNLEAARLVLRMKDGETKLTAPNLESREMWKGFLYSVVDLNVPACLTLLPGQLQMLKEVVDKERSRRRARTPTRAPPSPLSVPLVLLERHPDCGNMLLRPGRDGCSLAVTTRQDLNGSVFRHYRVTQREQGGYIIDVENPVTYVSSNDENGERMLHTAPSSPLPKAPALPPKQGVSSLHPRSKNTYIHIGCPVNRCLAPPPPTAVS
ncbi:hypothetical protein CRUP_011149 [Coryphaenoides rupestris]|nr:hypothetical protein CRUP_011149 [Coryphaenoides rupestris]